MPIIKKTGFMVHPEGLYRARLTEVVEADSLNPDWPAQFRCTFRTEMTDPMGEHILISYYVSQKLNSQSKFGQLAKALGVNIDQIPNGEEFNTDDLLNFTCCLVIEHQEKVDGAVKVKVTSVLPDNSVTSTLSGDDDDVDNDDGGAGPVPF